jgi:hypothetical protein
MSSDHAPKKKRCKRSAHHETVASSTNSSTQKQIATKPRAQKTVTRQRSSRQRNSRQRSSRQRSSHQRTLHPRNLRQRSSRPRSLRHQRTLHPRNSRPRSSRQRNNSYAAFGKWTPQKHKTWCHPGLRAGPSTIQGAGTGVFATQPIKAGTHLGYYCGRVYWRYPKQNARDWAYMLHLERRPPWIPVDVWHLKRTLKRNSNSSATCGTNNRESRRVSRQSTKRDSRQSTKRDSRQSTKRDSTNTTCVAKNKSSSKTASNKTAKQDACVCVDGRGTLSLINCCRGKLDETTTLTPAPSKLDAESSICNSEPTAKGAKGARRNDIIEGARCKNTKQLENKATKKSYDKRQANLGQQHVALRNNCTFGSTGRFETTRDIQTGQELFVDYGTGYWEER